MRVEVPTTPTRSIAIKTQFFKMMGLSITIFFDKDGSYITRKVSF